jgi:hypothetical protein
MPKNRLLEGVVVSIKNQGMRSDIIEEDVVGRFIMIVIYSFIIIWNFLTDSRGVHIQRKATGGLDKRMMFMINKRSI